MATEKKTRIVLIGTGAVGSSYAFALLNNNLADELVLIDVNEKKAEGDAIDLNHGLPFSAPMKIWKGDYADCRDADLVVLTAGSNQAPGEFFFNDTATTEIYTLSLHDALPIYSMAFSSSPPIRSMC